MDMKRLGFLVVCLIVFAVLIMERAGGRFKKRGIFFDSGDSLLVLPQNVDVEPVWLNCGVKTIDIKKFTETLESPFIKDKVCGFTKTGIRGGLFEVITPLSSEVKCRLSKCMVKKGFAFHLSGNNDKLRNINKECLQLLLGCYPVLRRHLGDQTRNISPAFSSSPGPASELSPAPGAALDSVPTPSLKAETPSPSPAPSSDVSPGSSPSPVNELSALSSDISPPGPYSIYPAAAPFTPQKDEINQKRLIIIAVVLSSAGTVLLLACGFCCYKKCRGKGGSITWKDERPLLNSGLSDFFGSPHMFTGPGGSLNKDKLGTMTLKVDSSQNGHELYLNVNSEGTPLSDIISGYANTSTVPSLSYTNGFEPKVGLPLPPGMRPSPEPKAGLTLPPEMRPPHVVFPTDVPSASLAPSHAISPPPPPVPPPIKKASPSIPSPPPSVPNAKPGTRPPPPPKCSVPVQPPQGSSSSRTTHTSTLSQEGNDSAPKTKLKPFFWDKVLANPDQSMVWHQIRSGSFQFNEEMIETLFGYNSAGKTNHDSKKESSASDPSSQYIQLLDPKKSQNLAISLKALNVKTEEVCDALVEGNELPAELLQALLRMQPSTDEELKLRLYTGDMSLLGPAEQFLKALVDIPFAFKRMDVLLFMSSLHEDVSSMKESLATLEVACAELRSSRLFLKLLEAVLKTGNRMNDGTYRGDAQAFKLDTLLKLSDVKGSDGKTTLLHFVVQEIIRSEGVRAARVVRERGCISGLTNCSTNSDDVAEESEDDYRNLGLKVVSGLSSELENVKKAAGFDIDALTSTVASFGHRLIRVKEFLNTDMRSLQEQSGFHDSLKCFVEHAEAAITFLLEEEKRISSLVHKTTDYFHGNAGKDEGLRLFVIIRDFLGMLDKVCKEVKESTTKAAKTPRVINNSTSAPVPDPRQLLYSTVTDRHVNCSSSDEDGP